MVMKDTDSSKIYDATNAESLCSTMNGSCQLDLVSPNTQFTVGKPGNQYMALSFVACVATYAAILGSVIIIVYLILNYLGACKDDQTREDATQARDVTEIDPLIPKLPFRLPYGTGDEDDLESGSASSSEDLYDGKVCVICYEEPRNCCFVPCGHYVTCCSCAQRIMGLDPKACPICRMLVHEVRKLLIP